MNESDTRLHKIDPKLKAAGWAYIRSGVDELRMDKLKTQLELKFGSVPEGISSLGGVPQARQTFKEFQQRLYA